MDDDLSHLSVRELKEELAVLGLSASGCVERSEIEQKLRVSRSQNKVDGAHRPDMMGGDHTKAATTRTNAPQSGNMSQPDASPFAAMAASLQGVFDTVGGSFGGMMDKVTGKFDAMDNRLDSLEAKRRQLKESIQAKQPQTALGRLNQLKAAAGAHDLEQKLQETKEQTEKEKKSLTAQVQRESMAAAQGLMQRPS